MSEYLSNTRQIVDIVRGKVFVVDSIRDIDFSFWLREFVDCFCHEAGRKLVIHKYYAVHFPESITPSIYGHSSQNKVYIEAYDMGI